MAARKGRLECVKVLVGWGADVNEVVKKIEKKSAVKSAELKGDEGIGGILRVERGNRVATLVWAKPTYVRYQVAFWEL